MALNGEELPSYEVILAVEATSNLAAHWEALKKYYIVPIIQYFHTQSVTSDDVLASLSRNMYGLVLFYAADRTPDFLTECFAPVKNHINFLKLLDSIDFNGGGAEHHSHVAEGLATAAQLFKDMNLQQQKTKVEKICLLISNTPPYELPVVESLGFSGLNCQELAKKLKDLDIKLSIISPHLIKDLKQLFIYANDVKPPVMNFAQDKRHLVLISGFHITLEKEPQLLSEAATHSIAPVKSEPITSMDVTQVISAADTIVSSSTSIKVEPSNQTQYSQTSGSVFGDSNPLTMSNQVKPTPNVISTSFPNPSSANVSYHSESSSFPSTITVDLPKTNSLSTSFVSKAEPKASKNYEQAQIEAKKVLEFATNQEFEKLGPNIEVIWTGTLEWNEKRRLPNKITHTVPCQIAENLSNATTRINATNWNSKLVIQLIPQTIINQSSQLHTFLKSNRQVILSFPSHQTQMMANMFQQKSLFGLIQNLTPQPNDGKVIAVFYRKKEDKGSFYGLIPNDSAGFFTTLRIIIQNFQRQRQAAVTAQGSQNLPQTLPQANNLSASEQTIKTGLQAFRNPQQQFQNSTFQQSDLNSQGGVQIQSQQLNPSLNSAMNNMKSINVTISTQPTINIRSQTGQTILQPPSNVTVINRGIASTDGARQLRANQSTMSGNIANQGALSVGSNIQIQRHGLVRMINNSGGSGMASNRPIAQNSNQQLRSMGPSVIPGNRPITQSLRSLLSANNMHMRQQDNNGLRATAPNNMQQQTYIRNSNIMPGMQNQRNF